MPKKQTKAVKTQKAAKLPNEIAGVKIGRDLRSAVEPLLRFASHPLVSDTLAAALIAGADALTGDKKGKAKAKAKAGAAPASGAKGGGPVALMLAVAAGEIASRIVSAYEGKAAERRAKSERRASDADRRTAAAARKKGAERRASTADRRSKPDRREA